MKKIQLSIPEPCHQNWDNMSPTQQGRFCNACAKQVIDFSEMSDADVLNYFIIEKSDKLCGRAYPDQLNRPITNLHARKLPWYWTYLVTMSLFFSRSTAAKAQGRVNMKTPALKSVFSIMPNNVIQQARVNAGIVIRGVIQNEASHAVPFATVRVLGSDYGVSADEEGKFLLHRDSLPCIIEISCVNYETKQITVNDLSENKVLLTPNNRLACEVVVTSTGLRPLHGRLGGLSITRTIVKRNVVKDTIKSWISSINPAIKIYPNPITKGSSVTVGFTLKRTGIYTIQIVNVAGSVLLERKMNAIIRKHNEQVLISKTWSGGIYYLRVIDDKGKYIGTGNIVVQ